MSYQWQASGDGGVTFTNILGATSANYTNATTPPSDNGTEYRVMVNTTYGSLTSSPPAVLTVGTISADPTSATASPATITNGGWTLLTLNGGGGGANEMVAWYSDSCGGTLAGVGNNLVVDPTANTTYYGRYEDATPCGYNSACQAVTVTVSGSTSAPIISTTGNISWSR